MSVAWSELVIDQRADFALAQRAAADVRSASWLRTPTATYAVGSAGLGSGNLPAVRLEPERRPRRHGRVTCVERGALKRATRTAPPGRTKPTPTSRRRLWPMWGWRGDAAPRRRRPAQGLGFGTRGGWAATDIDYISAKGRGARRRVRLQRAPAAAPHKVERPAKARFLQWRGVSRLEPKARRGDGLSELRMPAHDRRAPRFPLKVGGVAKADQAARVQVGSLLGLADLLERLPAGSAAGSDSAVIGRAMVRQPRSSLRRALE